MMRSAVLLAVLALVSVVRGRSLLEPIDVDIHVDGHSQAQLNAMRYDTNADQVSAPTVVLPGLGSVRGSVSYTEQGKRPIFQYFAIPFAEAPVGELRFVAPVPKKPWNGEFDASLPGKACIQTDSTTAFARRRRDLRVIPVQNQSEDCLVLDVHTPQVNSSAKLPVLVFIHGGAFIEGWAGQKTPQGLLDEDVILVSPQYRLGPFGFLNLQTDEIPGNAGLLDQVEALRWVQKYIHLFGGDPDRVTLGGHSAGAASSSLLYLSPLTKGLIRGVMPMSGSAVGFWAWDRNPEPANTIITKMAGCGTPLDPIAQRVACLRQRSPKQLVQGFLLYAVNSLGNGKLGMSGTLPSVQTAGAVRVLPDLPENIMSTPEFNALPYLTGVTKHEGTYPLRMAENGFLKPKRLMSNSSFLRNDLSHVLLQVVGVDDPASFVSDSVLQAYFDLTTLGDYTKMRDGLIDSAGAFGFKSPARRIVERNALLGQPSYLYAFNYNGANTRNDPQGIFHGADQPYIFPQGTVLEGDDLKVALALRKMVSNFVIYQDPTPAESPVTVAGSPSWSKWRRDSEHFMEVVWPPAQRQWFSSQLKLAREEGFTENFGKDITSTPTSNDRASGSTNARSPAVATLAVSVVLAILAGWNL